MNYYQKLKILIVYGGKDNYVTHIKDLFLNDLHIFNIKNNTWTVVDIKNNKLKRRAFHTSCFSGSKFVMWGGVNARGMVSRKPDYLELD